MCSDNVNVVRDDIKVDSIVSFNHGLQYYQSKYQNYQITHINTSTNFKVLLN